MSFIFYNKRGTPMVYTDNNTDIFYFTGEAIAYIHEMSVFSYEGKHLGFFKDGWIRDNNGKCVLFTKGAIGGPEKRMKDIAPVISQKGNIPSKKTREHKKIELIINQEWTEITVKEFFNQ